jgi:hypothetical protein
VLCLAIKYGKIGKLDRIDYFSIFLSIIAIILWVKTDNPFYGSLFATIADTIGYIPTLRKVWKKPESEPTGYYLIMNIKHIFSLLSLSVYSWTTMIFSGSIIIMNFILIIIQIFRRRK